MYQQPSAWRSRWPTIVAAVALVAISFSAGMLVERSRHGDTKDVEKATASATARLGGEDGNKNSAQANSSVAPAADAFQGVVISTVCKRLHSCGMLNSFSKQMCEEMAAKASDPTASARVKKGQCTYDKSAASACLASIQRLKCDMNSSNLMDWVDSAGKLNDCNSAFRCR